MIMPVIAIRFNINSYCREEIISIKIFIGFCSLSSTFGIVCTTFNIVYFFDAWFCTFSTIVNKFYGFTIRSISTINTISSVFTFNFCDCSRRPITITFLISGGHIDWVFHFITPRTTICGCSGFTSCRFIYSL